MNQTSILTMIGTHSVSQIRPFKSVIYRYDVVWVFFKQFVEVVVRVLNKSYVCNYKAVE